MVSELKTAMNANPKSEFNFRIFPNPANNSTEISFVNPNFQKINISVYSADGKLVEVIANKYLNSGKQQFSFGRKTNPGLYFICLNTASFKKVEKVVIR